MTQTVTEPTIDIPIEIITPTAECTAGYTWCGGDECNDKVQVEPGDEDWQEDDYHRGVISFLPMLRFTAGGWKDLEDVTLIVRHDENEGADTKPLIMIDYPYRECGPAMTPEQARKNAAWLLNAADLLDPVPTGAMATTAVNVRIGDELLTVDGWQKVIGLLFDSETEQASVFTTGQDMDNSQGWPLSFNDPVKVRRSVHGSCAIQFVEPVR